MGTPLARRGDLGRREAPLTRAVAALDVVTGAFSFTGRHIAERLLEQGRSVRTLTREPPEPGHPLAGRVAVAPLRFDRTLLETLQGADTLYNTYWVRFERGATTFAGAVANIGRLLEAAAEARVRRVVHVSVANPDDRSPFPYYRGKAEAEALVRESGLSYAIVRPTVVFGLDDILVNNVAWALRRVPLFLVPGDGGYEVQPVSVEDVARIAVDAGNRRDDVALDAAGERRWSYEEFIRLIRAAVEGRARIARAPFWAALATARAAGLALHDVIVTRDELESLRAGLLVSHKPPLGRERFDTWLAEHGKGIGRTYTSELRRNFRRRSRG
jgi:nucleoside-diphosphate-sugar epimerase